MVSWSNFSLSFPFLCKTAVLTSEKLSDLYFCLSAVFNVCLPVYICQSVFVCMSSVFPFQPSLNWSSHFQIWQFGAQQVKISRGHCSTTFTIFSRTAGNNVPLNFMWVCWISPFRYVYLLYYMWLSHVEIKCYFITYIDCIAAFEAPYHWTSGRGRVHMCFVDSLDIHASVKHIWAPPLTEAQQYGTSNAAMQSKYAME